MLIEGDCLKVLPTLPAESFDTIIASPPYGVGKEYESGSYSEWRALINGFWAVAPAVIKPGGFVAFVVGDVRCHPDPLLPSVRAEVRSRQASVTAQDVIDAVIAGRGKTKGEIASALGVSDQTIDRRLLGNNARGGKAESQTRVRLMAEDLIPAASAAGFYLYDCRIWVKDPCWQTCEYHATSYRAVDECEHVYIWVRAGDTLTIDRSRLERREWSEWGGRAVWSIPSVRRNDIHPAMYPEEIARRLCKLLAPPGGRVLDPFAGSGTTLLAANAEGRSAVGIERDAGYCEIIRKRLAEAESNQGLFAETV